MNAGFDLDSARELTNASGAAIRKGSKSFSLASLLFPRDLRVAAHHLYAWCRYCDDAIDEARTREDARRALERLRRETAQAFAGAAMAEPAFRALQAVAVEHGIPREYADELLAGMEMDVEGAEYRTLEDLELYCFRVASVVGLMMCGPMGLSSPEALKLAARAGMAMQMTNVARDVADDWRMGRRYLPADWFQGARAPDPAFDQFDASSFVAPTKRLLEIARLHYDAGRHGLRYLPFRAAVAVGAAIEIYEDIGRLVLARGPRAWDARAVVSKPRKAWLAVRGFFRALATLPARVRRPWRRVSIDSTYRFEGYGEAPDPA